MRARASVIKLDKVGSAVDALIDNIEKIKVGIRAKVKHPFRVIKRWFGLVKVRYWQIAGS